MDAVGAQAGHHPPAALSVDWTLLEKHPPLPGSPSPWKIPLQPLAQSEANCVSAPEAISLLSPFSLHCPTPSLSFS